MTVLRILATGVAAAATWWAGIMIVFGPAQSILADPARQSAKFLAAFGEEPLPRMAAHPEVVPLGLLGIGLLYACAFELVGTRLPGSTFVRGIRFGFVAWLLLIPWFEFYLPWNVMLEPWPLVLLEGLCWMIVLLGVGVVTSGVNRVVRRRPALAIAPR